LTNSRPGVRSISTFRRKLHDCCLNMSPIDHLHSETNLLTLPVHNRLLSDQYFVSTRRHDHPCRHLFGCPGPPVRRQGNFRIKHTLERYSAKRAQRHLAASPPDASLKQQHKLLRTHAVKACRSRFIKPNPFLQRRPPQISPTEKALTRNCRSKLAQLRCGYCSLLATTRAKLDSTGQTPDTCPRSLTATEDTPHLLNCPAGNSRNPVLDLWKNPRAIAAAQDSSRCISPDRQLQQQQQ